LSIKKALSFYKDSGFFDPTKSEKYFYIGLISCFSINAQTSIFNPSMLITEFGTVVSEPNEDVTKIIDGDINTKFIDSQIDDGIGFTVYLGSGVSNIASSIEVTTANDVPSRDPVSFEVLGSNDNVSYTSITTGTIPCISDRGNSRTFTFSNTTSYSYYRIVYSTQCSSTDTYLQIAETQLFESVALGLEDMNLLNKELTIVPNSSRDIFNLNYLGKDILKEILIMNAVGEIIQRIPLNDFNLSKELNLSNLSSGLFFIKVSSNKTTVTKKILVK